MTILSVSRISAGYGQMPVLRDATLSIETGVVAGIVGHNGAGKTTFLKTLIGLVRSTAGQVVFNGANITDWPPNRRARMGLGYIPQGRGIFPGLSVQENLELAAIATGKPVAAKVEEVVERISRVKRLLGRVGGTLSGGEQQLVAFARCLCGEPKLILLDEPTEGIQPSIIDEIKEIIRDLRMKERISVLLVEQNVEFLSALSDEIWHMQRGHLVAVNAPPGVDVKSRTQTLAGLIG